MAGAALAEGNPTRVRSTATAINHANAVDQRKAIQSDARAHNAARADAIPQRARVRSLAAIASPRPSLLELWTQVRLLYKLSHAVPQLHECVLAHDSAVCLFFIPEAC